MTSAERVSAAAAGDAGLGLILVDTEVWKGQGGERAGTGQMTSLMDTEVQNEGGGGAFIQILATGLTRITIPPCSFSPSPPFSLTVFSRLGVRTLPS